MISVTILTKNSAKTLRKTLASLATFPEVVILDTGSTDASLSIAREFSNVRIEHSPFIGFGPLHNLASSLATHEWILSIDSDEVLTSALIEEISQLALHPGSVYSLPRHNFFNHKHMKWCSGWHPDRIIRLYHRKATSFTCDLVHEKIACGSLKEVKLKAPLNHYPYLQAADFLQKMQHYSELFVEQNRGRKKGSLFQAILHSWFAFFKSYILKRGFLGGKEGFIISAYNGHTAFYKYLKLFLTSPEGEVDRRGEDEHNSS